MVAAGAVRGVRPMPPPKLPHFSNIFITVQYTVNLLFGVEKLDQIGPIFVRSIPPARFCPPILHREVGSVGQFYVFENVCRYQVQNETPNRSGNYKKQFLSV